jgi:hypothetical protein
MRSSKISKNLDANEVSVVVLVVTDGVNPKRHRASGQRCGADNFGARAIARLHWRQTFACALLVSRPLPGAVSGGRMLAARLELRIAPQATRRLASTAIVRGAA